MKKANQEQIDAWKEKYPTADIWQITVEDKTAYLRSPDRKTLSMASTVGASDPMKFNEILLVNCWLDGDIEIQKDDKYFLSASSKLAQLIEIKETEMVKL